jgi:hypothetical protein
MWLTLSGLLARHRLIPVLGLRLNLLLRLALSGHWLIETRELALLLRRHRLIPEMTLRLSLLLRLALLIKIGKPTLRLRRLWSRKVLLSRRPLTGRSLWVEIGKAPLRCRLLLLRRYLTG